MTTVNLAKYFGRVGLRDLQPPYTADRDTLKRVMEAQSKSIAFENIDVVQKKSISMDLEDVQKKLVEDVRGGYCFEQNTLLKAVLEEMGYSVEPSLCRVRWGKQDDSAGPNTTFTHLVLKVFTKDGIFLADVGFAGTNSIEPVRMDIGGENQELPEGRFRIVPSKHKGFFVLELLVKGEWRPLYEWRDEKAPLVDQECCNWFSCTNPKGRFTSQFFVCKIIGEERHHILNDQYVIRKGFGANSQVTTDTISDKARLETLVSDVFGIKLEDTSGIDRFLS
ncbi:unnamed protein product [Cylindrotheca closterium]|uniref:Arylamine N-acetyltransferase n=1 Tax=Cylindrotheca closterium TaxID=2856 RepID=A0AAD2G5X9_9STRA|nr:unnamed protein product [Cylindrotheca closterium]